MFDTMIIGQISLDHNIDYGGREEYISGGAVTFSGYAAADCEGLVRVDATKRAVSWKGGDLSRFAGKSVRFRFNMKVATLYAFWVSKDAAGKSGGYLAAGGPGYAGPKDE